MAAKPSKPCGACRGEGTVKFLHRGEWKKKKCIACRGTGRTAK